MQPAQITSRGLSRPIDFYNFDLTVLRYHMFSIMPGDLSEDIHDFDKLKVAIYDERQKDEIYRFQLHGCGDGFLNSTFFEMCDYNRVPPAGDKIYPANPKVYLSENGYRMCTNICTGE